VPSCFETAVSVCSVPRLIAFCIAAQNASSIFSCVLRIESSSSWSSSIIIPSPAMSGQPVDPQALRLGESTSPPLSFVQAPRFWPMQKSVEFRSPQTRIKLAFQTLEHCGLDMYFDQQALDTTTPAGKLMFQVTGAFAELLAIAKEVGVGSGTVQRIARETAGGGAPFDPESAVT
jgi:hypothetical protein